MPPEGKSSWILCNKADIMYIDIPTSVHKLRVITNKIQSFSSTKLLSYEY